jgi:hypothetical protein
MSPESAIHHASYLAARMSVERPGERHPGLGVRRLGRRLGVFDLDSQPGVIAHTGERLGKFEHVRLAGYSASIILAMHIGITANLKRSVGRDHSHMIVYAPK